jgi:hypothetical protein
VFTRSTIAKSIGRPNVQSDAGTSVARIELREVAA